METSLISEVNNLIVCSQPNIINTIKSKQPTNLILRTFWTRKWGKKPFWAPKHFASFQLVPLHHTHVYPVLWRSASVWSAANQWKLKYSFQYCALIAHLAIKAGKEKAFGHPKHMQHAQGTTDQGKYMLATGAQVSFHRSWQLPNSWNRIFRPIISKCELINHYSFHGTPLFFQTWPSQEDKCSSLAGQSWLCMRFEENKCFTYINTFHQHNLTFSI